MKNPVILPLVTVLAMASALAAQNDRGFISVYPDSRFASATYIDRGIGNPPSVAPVECLNEMPQGLVFGVGDNGTACQIGQITFVIQDQQNTTQDTAAIIMRPRDAQTLAPSRTQTIFQTAQLGLPTGVNGARAMGLVTTFTTPITVPCNSYFYGLALPSAPNWPTTDGVALQAAAYTLGTTGDNPRANAPELGWSYDGTQAPATDPHGWSVALLPAMPTVAAGANDPNSTRTAATTGHSNTTFGAGGFYPDISGTNRSDGIDVRIYDAGAPGGLCGILFSFGVQTIPTSISLPGVTIRGRLYLDPAQMTVWGARPIAATAPEESITPFLPPSSIPSSVTGNNVYFQALTIDGNGAIALSNAVGMNL
ncbi:MAG: hypothetical protein IPM29_08535 [Planctomycetes bacterium]|nr:hypothetical protein [Planctomycetota bacterium]